MYKRKDSDIFGTKQVVIHPKIENNNDVDPYAPFKKQT